jgi:ATP-dependent RNA helicase DeaD
LVERYARRALVTGPLGADLPAGPPVRVVTVAWSQRPAALAALIETEDPPSTVVWCADQVSAETARHALPAGDDSIQVVTGEPPRAALVVGWDLPAPEQLAQMSAVGGLVLLAPAHAAAYLRRATSSQTPVRLPGPLEASRQAAADRRRAISAELARGELDGELLALAPLLERFDPAAIAAALYRLWQATPAAAAPRPAEAAAPAGPGRLWVGVGRKDGATPADLVAVLTKEAGVPAARIGRIELREVFSLVEVPAAEAEQIARRLSGKTVRRRTLTARVDRGGRR